MATLAEVLDAAARTQAARTHTGIPAKVKSYDPTTNTVEVDIVVKDVFVDIEGDRDYTEHPTIPNVPVLWPRSGGKILRFPIAAGDHVWLCFAEASLAEWRTSGQVSEPLDARKHSIGYPYALPGAEPDTKPPSPADVAEVTAGAVILGADGGDEQLLIGGTVAGFRMGKTAVQPVALAPGVLTALAAILADLTAASGAIVTAQGYFAGKVSGGAGATAVTNADLKGVFDAMAGTFTGALATLVTAIGAAATPSTGVPSANAKAE